MVEYLLPLALDFATVTPESSRALQARDLAEFIQSKGIRASQIGNVDKVKENLKSDAKNIAFGSLYFIGEIKAFFQNEQYIK